MSVSLPDSSYIHTMQSPMESKIDFESNFLGLQTPYIPDQNAQNYSSGQVLFDLRSISGQNIILSESYLGIPVQVAPATGASTTGYTTAYGMTGGNSAPFSACTWKSSSIAIVNSLLVQTAGGQVICNEATNATVFMNSIRQLLDEDYDYSREASTLNFLGVDKNTQSSIQFGMISSGTPQNSINASNCNPTLYNRAIMQSNQSTVLTAGLGQGGFAQNVFIPLRLLHDFFKQMSFPVAALSLQIQFNISGIGGQSAFMPFTVATSGGSQLIDKAGNALNGSYPYVSVVPTNNVNGYTMGSCKLYIKVAALNPHQAKIQEEQIKSGFEKKIQYLVSDFFVKPSEAPAGGQASLTTLITQSSVMPIRVWMMSCKNPSATYGFSSANSLFPGSVFNSLRFTNLNIQINNQTYYSNNLQSPYDTYELLKAEMPPLILDNLQSGKSASFIDHLNGATPLVFNLERYFQGQLMPNQQVSLNLIANCTDIGSSSIATNTDILFVVERLQTLKLKYTPAGLELTVSGGVL